MKRVTIAVAMVCAFAFLAAADYMQPKNLWEGTLDTNYVEGTDAEISIGDTTGWPTSGVVYIDDGTEWILVRYDSLDAGNGDLETLSDADADFDSASGQGHTFNAGTAVILAQAADYNRQLVEDITGAVSGGIFFESSNELGTSALLTFGGTDFVVDTSVLVVETDDDQVGIGTAAPASILHLYGAANQIIALQSSNNQATEFVGLGTGDFVVGHGGPGDISFRIAEADAYNHVSSAGEKMVILSTGAVGIGTGAPSGNLDVNAATDADAHILLSENDATKWDLYNDHNDDHLQLMSGSTLRYEFGTDGTAVADVAWNTFSPRITAQGRGLLDVAMEDASKPVKPYAGIPVVLTDAELALQTRSERLPNEFPTQELRDVEVERYSKNIAEIAIASARYLAHLTAALEAQGIKIPELPEEIAELVPLDEKRGMSAGELAGSLVGAMAAGGAAVEVVRRKMRA